MATDFTANHRIKRILISYQETAERSLNGPRDEGAAPIAAHRQGAGVVPGESEGRCGGHRPPVVSRSHGPAGKGRDHHGPWKRSLGPDKAAGATAPGKCEILETTLEGERMGCFEVGGEQRLCMPQILSTVLRDFVPSQVFEVCEELHIFFSRCDPDQLGALIRAKILPQNVTTCGLITYTNAERMCSTLLRNQLAYKYRLPVANEGLKVYHECFGGCRGVLMPPNSFEFPSKRCVQCAECGEMFAPAQFVSHSHSELENGTIHWGFNPVNWRSYLMLSLEQTGYPRIQELLDSLKAKFEDGSDDNKEDKIVIKQEVDDIMPVKRIRYEGPNILATTEGLLPKWVPADVGGAWKFCVGLCKQLDGIKIRSDDKLPPYLRTENPYLADSDRVIPYTESQWADGSFAPNVSLDPAPYKNLHDLYDDEDDCDETEPEEDAAAAAAQSCRWSSSLAPSGVSDIFRSAYSPGNISDDELEDSESVLSDKLPSMTEVEDQACGHITDICNARLGLLIRALEGEELHPSGTGDPLKEFIRLQEQHSDVVGSLADNNNALSQRRLYLWTLMEEKLRAMEEVRKNQDEELACAKQEGAMKIREAMLERHRLMEQIENLSKGSVDSDLAVVTQYKDEAEILRKQLQSAEDMNSTLRREISDLHRAIETLSQGPDRGPYAPLVVQPPDVATTLTRARPAGRPRMTCPSSSVCSQGV